MFNFFKSKKTDLELTTEFEKQTDLEITALEKQTDLELLKQLEQTIGKKLAQLDLFPLYSVGYVQNEHNQITGLGLYDCGLKELPPEIGNLQNLTELSLGINKLSTLPPEIGNRQNLIGLDLPSNQLSSLPPEIGNRQNLTELNLHNNQLNQFTKALLDLNLELEVDEWVFFTLEKRILVGDNPFQTPPVEIVKQGRQAIIDYYAALEEQQKRPLNESKLILIGDGAAGKTSLMKRLLGLDFDPHESQTHGININTLTIKDNQHNDIKLHCWDFGESCTPPINFFSPNAVYTYSSSTVGVKPKSTIG